MPLADERRRVEHGPDELEELRVADVGLRPSLTQLDDLTFAALLVAVVARTRCPRDSKDAPDPE